MLYVKDYLILSSLFFQRIVNKELIKYNIIIRDFKRKGDIHGK